MADGSVDIEPASQTVAGETPVEESKSVTGETTVPEHEVELHRGIGLVGGLAIEIGAMIGASIFILQGFLADKPCLAAMLSFTIGGEVPR